jgi:ferric-dicitrate binding protein FerR (iron transport regulator)
MSEDREKELLRLAEAVSDGTPVDWEREQGSNPGMKEPLEHLALLDRVRRVHEESSRVLIATDRKSGRVESAAAGPASALSAAPASVRSRRRTVWVAIGVLLAVATLVWVLYRVYRAYSNATNAAM